MIQMTLAKVGRRGSLVIPAKERRSAKIEEGDHVEVIAKEAGMLVIKKIQSLEEVQEKMAGKLPQWSELEGKADELIEKEL